MAKSRLHELSEQGVSVWIDSLSREMLETGELARLMKEDAVVGVTSNPTIFQKALSSGDWYDERLAEVMKTEDDPTEIFLQLAKQDVQDACDLLRPVWDEGERPRRLGLARGRPDARLRPRGDLRAGDPLPRRGRPAEPVRQDPGDAAGARRDRGLHREGQADQRDADLLARSLRGGRRGLHQGPRAPRRRGRGPDARRLRRQLLRLARRHGGRPAARRDRRPGHPLEGEARDRERQARLPPLAGDVRRSPLGVPGREGCDAAALPVGVDLDEEPGVPRRDVRRGADRAADGEHDAGGDDRRLPGSRQGRPEHHHRGRGRGAEAARAARRGRGRLRRRRRNARGGRRAEVRRLLRGAARRDPSKAQRNSLRRDEPSSTGSGRTTRRSGPTPARTAGSGGSTSSAESVRASPS